MATIRQLEAFIATAEFKCELPEKLTLVCS